MASKSIALAFIAAAELRSGGIITEQEINAPKKRWSRCGLANKSGGYADEVEHVEEHGPYRISAEQSAKGLAWWMANTHKATGEWRNNKFVAEMSEYQRHILDTFAHFELAGWHEEYNGYGSGAYSPIYRVVATDGAHFDYVGRSWQSGGVGFV